METLSPDAIAGKIAADAPPPSPAVTAQPSPVTAVSPAPVTDQGAPAAAGHVETDSRGTPFDAKKHSGKKHPHSGVWMPRGGRKPKTAPVVPSAGAPAGPVWSDAEHAAASAPAIEANAELVADGKPAPGAPPVAKSKDAAEVACRSLYAVVGAVTKSGAEAKADPEDHANLRDTAAAYIDSKGWAFVGVFALGIAFVAYLLRIGERPKVAEWVKSFFNRKKDAALESDSTIAANAGPGAAAGAIVAESGKVIPPLA